MPQSIGESRRLPTESPQRYTQRTPRYQGEFSSHNVYYVKKAILLDNSEKACYTDYVDSHRGFLEYQRGGSTQRTLRDTGRCLGGTVRYSHRMGYGIGGVCFLLCCVIYKCNNFPVKYFTPTPQNLLDFR